jgi:plasmid stabilization system protein ParE
VKRLKLKITQLALDQIREQIFYIAQDSVDNALAWEDRLLAALKGLSEFHGHAIDEDARERLGGTTQKMVFERTYLVHYEVNENAGVVTVVNIRHGARLPRKDEL